MTIPISILDAVVSSIKSMSKEELKGELSKAQHSSFAATVDSLVSFSKYKQEDCRTKGRSFNKARFPSYRLTFKESKCHLRTLTGNQRLAICRSNPFKH